MPATHHRDCRKLERDFDKLLGDLNLPSNASRQTKKNVLDQLAQTLANETQNLDNGQIPPSSSDSVCGEFLRSLQPQLKRFPKQEEALEASLTNLCFEWEKNRRPKSKG